MEHDQQETQRRVNMDLNRKIIALEKRIQILRTLCHFGEWQPIETAPKTSHAILVWVPENKCTFAVTWDIRDEGLAPTWRIFGGGYRAFLQYDGSPTHWMPLPAPPE